MVERHRRAKDLGRIRRAADTLGWRRMPIPFRPRLTGLTGMSVVIPMAATGLMVFKLGDAGRSGTAQARVNGIAVAANGYAAAGMRAILAANGAGF
jgi:hypothetical protein